MTKEAMEELKRMYQAELLFGMFLVERKLAGEFQEWCAEKTASALPPNFIFDNET